MLSDGRVLVVGGAQSYSGRPLPTAELFDPVRMSAAGVGASEESFRDALEAVNPQLRAAA